MKKKNNNKETYLQEFLSYKRDKWHVKSVVCIHPSFLYFLFCVYIIILYVGINDIVNKYNK